MLDFDFSQVLTTEFGVGVDMTGGQRFNVIPVDRDVQIALQSMAADTWTALNAPGELPQVYEPSEKYASTEYVLMPLKDDFGAQMRELHDASNLPVSANVLSDPTSIYCYFARMTDQQG